MIIKKSWASLSNFTNKINKQIKFKFVSKSRQSNSKTPNLKKIYKHFNDSTSWKINDLANCRAKSSWLSQSKNY